MKVSMMIQRRVDLEYTTQRYVVYLYVIYIYIYICYIYIQNRATLGSEGKTLEMKKSYLS